MTIKVPIPIPLSCTARMRMAEIMMAIPAATKLAIPAILDQLVSFVASPKTSKNSSAYSTKA